MQYVKKLSPQARLCPLCAHPSKKKGFTSAGRQRWYCPDCRYSFTARRCDQSKATQFREFLAYVTDTAPRRSQTTSLSTGDRSHAWCWDTRPIWQVTGEVYDQIFIDGTYIPYGWCVLIASTPEGVIAYQLCHRENKAAYRALLSRIPAPIVVVTDGDKGALAAIKECWPSTIVQRCLVHIQRNIRRITTLKPHTDQHKALRQLGLDLTRIRTIDEAITWQKSLAAFHELYDPWLNEKTYRDHVTTSNIPTFARNNKRWWFTHHDTRRMVRSLDRYVKEGVLFTYLRTDLDVHSLLASTTNPLEGGINSPLKAFLYAHRGWPEHHMLTAINYWLYTRSIDHQPLETFMNNTVTPSTKPELPAANRPAEIDTHINTHTPWEDNLTIRKGWIHN